MSPNNDSTPHGCQPDLNGKCPDNCGIKCQVDDPAKAISVQELGEILRYSDIYRCNSTICGDNGGVCILIVPCLFEAPTSCTNPEAFSEEMETECDCKWEKIA